MKNKRNNYKEEQKERKRNKWMMGGGLLRKDRGCRKQKARAAIRLSL